MLKNRRKKDIPPRLAAPPPDTPLVKLAWAAALVLATFVAYSPMMTAGFIWDDDQHVTSNYLLRTNEGLARIWIDPLATPQYYPLVHTTFWLEYQMWGLVPEGYHLVNVLLHACAAVLCWRVLRQLGIPGALLAAALFALHPVNVESVAWVSERKNVLSGVFYLSALLAYLHYRPWHSVDPFDQEVPPRRSFKWYALASVLFVGALLSKTVTCSLPAVILLVFWWRPGRVRLGVLLEMAPWFVLGLICATYTTWLERYHVGALGEAWQYTVAERVLIAGRAVWFYLGKLIVPYPQSFFYAKWSIDATVWWQWLAPLGVLATFIGLWLARKRWGRGPLVAALIYVGTLVPALGLINVYPMRYAFVADHFQYLASISMFALAAALLTRAAPLLKSSRLVPRLAAAAWLAVLSGATIVHAMHFRDAETLYRHALASNPDGWHVHNLLGSTLDVSGRLEEAMEHYDAAARLAPDNVEVRNNLGRALAARGQFEEAIENYHAALKLDPRTAAAHYNLGNVYMRMGKPRDASQHYRSAIEISPDYVEAHINLGGALFTQQRYEEAAAALQRALELNPESAVAHNNLGSVMLNQQQYGLAARHFSRAVAFQPNYVDAWSNWGKALYAQRRFREAADRFNHALSLYPQHEESAQFLNAMLKQGQIAPLPR